MGSGFAKKKKQAKLLQEQLSQMQNKIQKAEVEGQSAGGLVTLTLTGEHELKKIVIKPECVDKDDIDGLQDLIKSAYNDARKKLDKETQMPKMPGFGNMGNLTNMLGM